MTGYRRGPAGLHTDVVDENVTDLAELRGVRSLLQHEFAHLRAPPPVPVPPTRFYRQV
ncbi:hypothetical protein D3C83_213580 [compost metagenome]